MKGLIVLLKASRFSEDLIWYGRKVYGQKFLNTPSHKKPGKTQG